MNIPTLKRPIVKATPAEGHAGYNHVFQPAEFTLSPAIEPASTRGSMDSFSHWEFTLLLDDEPTTAHLLLYGPVTLEMWTEDIDQPQDSWNRLRRLLRLGGKQWIRWVFPNTTWKDDRQPPSPSSRLLHGRSHNQPDTTLLAPDGNPVTAGAFWRTRQQPPKLT